MIGIVKSIYDEVVKASELLRDKGQINFKNDFEDCFTLSYNRYVGVTYSNPWEMPNLPHKSQNSKRNAALLSRAQEISKRREIWIKMPDPPDDFEFNIHYAMPFAVQALKTDGELRLARQIFVPSRMSVYNFWRKYFWYIELMKCEIIDQFQLGDSENPTEESSVPPSFRNIQNTSPNLTKMSPNLPSQSQTLTPSAGITESSNGASRGYRGAPKFYEQARVAVIREHHRKKLSFANSVQKDYDRQEHEGPRTRKVSFSDSPRYMEEDVEN